MEPNITHCLTALGRGRLTHRTALAIATSLKQRTQGDEWNYQHSLTQLLYVLETRDWPQPSSLEEWLDFMLTVGATSDDDKREHPTPQRDRVEEGFITCKCGSKRVKWETKQVRSVDEGATLFCTCDDCGKKWRTAS